MNNKKNIGIKTVLVFGSGPINIGQACEFDYSGTQACRALKEDGLRVILLNSNPATIMTDPDVADRTYIEALDPLMVVDIIRKENVDAILPTMGGQTGLNLILALSKVPRALDGVTVIGANLKAIHLAEDRKAFREVAASLGLDTPQSKIIRSTAECRDFAQQCGYPFILRPSFTLGGTGQSFVFNESELEEKTRVAIAESPIEEVLVEESVLGWKEYELELMRDHLDNAIVVCGIENLDPMGVHTGDSITVSPIQTLTDREYQIMRTEAIKVIRRVGVETGGCNVQFAVNPKNGRRIIIEMNPRVSRSSALASKATGFPIAYVATKLAIGYALSDIDNSVTKNTKACFEPTIDYVALKMPRWHFEKFPGSEDELLPQMQSVGEVLAFGSSFGEAYHKALNSLEKKWPDYYRKLLGTEASLWSAEQRALLQKAHSRRSFVIWDALANGVSVQELSELTEWDSWFLDEIKDYQANELLGNRAKRFPEGTLRFEMIDTCAGEMSAQTPYFYSTRDQLSFDYEKSVQKPAELCLPEGKKGRVVILGSGPNRIGQGVEFDYCCVQASQVLQKLGYESIMVNCNPETVSTDPHSSTRLYLEPLHRDSVKSILQRELASVPSEKAFVLLQTGGQTPLKLASLIEEWGYRVLGSSCNEIDLCEDRERFVKLLKELQVSFPEFSASTDLEGTLKEAQKIGYPLLVRPSYVLGGRGMRICETELDLREAFASAKEVSADYPLYLDRFLQGAVEYDVDGICDGEKAWVGGVMEHVEEAGVHSGDSACVIPPFRLPPNKIDEIAGIAKKIAVASGCKGLFNIQFAVQNERIFVIEANPRASRTVPFLSKATSYPMIEWGLRAALGESVAEVTQEGKIPGNYRLPSQGYAVKMPVFPFTKFKNFDPVLGPEMRSTGEVMGMNHSAGSAFAKAYLAAGVSLPGNGRILFSVKDHDKPRALNVARLFELLGFEIIGTPGTADYLARAGINAISVDKIDQNAQGDDLLNWIKKGKLQLIINTTGSLGSIRDGLSIRQAALLYRVPLVSTLAGAEMASMSIQSLKKGRIQPIALQDFWMH